MREITEKEYLDFVEKNKFVEIGKEKISLEPIKVERFEPKDEEMTATDTTVWSFPKRGDMGNPQRELQRELASTDPKGFNREIFKRGRYCP
jgi:hypothetical protein